MKYCLFPCNPAQYDVNGAFNEFNEIEWIQVVNKISVGDIVFIYVAKPFSEIQFMCEVVHVNIPAMKRVNKDQNYILDYGLDKRIKKSRVLKLLYTV